MGTIGPEKILVVLVVALIVLGPEKLPRMARQAGKAWSDFRRFREGLEAEVRGAFSDDEGVPITSPVASIRDTLRETVSSAGSPPAASAPASNGPAGPAALDPGATAGTSNLVPPPPPVGPAPSAHTPAPSDLPVPPDDPSLN